MLLAQDPASPSAIDALYALKYEGVRAASRPLAALLGTALAGELGTSRRLALVPVPTDAARRRARGFDQAELLAVEAGRTLGLPVLALLERARPTRRQVGLGRDERFANLREAFVARAVTPLEGLVLVDDVCTTGATFAAAAAALRQAGSPRVSAAALFGAIPDRHAGNG